MEISNNISSINYIFSAYQTARLKQPDSQVAVLEKDNSKNSAPNNIEDRAEISQESKDLLQQDKINQTAGTDKTTGEKNLSPEQEDQLNKLKQTNREVKAHEQAHLAASSGIATGAPSYTYEQGPDGKQYAVGGEVNIRATSGEDPEKTIEKAEQVKKAALAPTDPSTQDRSVASQADQMMQAAKAELKNNKDGDKNSSSSSPKVIADVF